MAKKVDKRLEEAFGKIEKRFGKGAVMTMDKKIHVEKTSSGSITLDRALGGGYPKGKFIEMYSPEACGKTGRALEAVCEVQKAGGVACYIDSEHSLNEEYARSIGVDWDALILSQPDCGEEAFEIARALAGSGAVSMIVLDSVSAMIPRAELEGETGESKMGLQARMMSQGCRQLTGVASDNGCTIIFINQLREKIGVMFGNPETTTGGNALKFYASQRLDIRKSLITEDKETIGFVQKIKVIKNKVAPPFKKANLNIFYDTGADKVGELVEIAVEYDIIQKSGSWYAYGESKLGQGLQKVVELMNDNPELYEEIENKVRKILAG